MCAQWLCLSVSPQGHNIFSNLSSTEYSDLMQLLKQSILATDLTLYFEYVPLNTARLIKALDLHRGRLTTASWLIYNDAVVRDLTLPPCGLVHIWRRCCFARVQEQELVLWAGQQWRVQLERQGSQRHVQVEPRTIPKRRCFLGSEITIIYMFPLRSMMMTACDLGAVTKPWDISRKVL